MQLNVKLYKITWYSIICVALPGILLLYLHILTTTHLNPNRCGLFVGFWLGIFAIHKTWTSLAFWRRIDDKTGTLAYPVWCIVWVVQTQLFAENSNRGRKVSPEKLKSSHSRRFLLEKSKKSKSRKVHIPGDFCSKSRKIRKIRKVEKSKNSKSRKVHIPGDFCSKSRKIRKIRKFEKSKNSKSRKVHIPGDFCSKSRKNRKIRKVEKFTFQEISARKVEKIEKFEKSKSRKVRKIRKVENFLTFWLFAKSFAIFALCDYRREERLVFWDMALWKGSTTSTVLSEIGHQHSGHSLETPHFGWLPCTDQASLGSGMSCRMSCIKEFDPHNSFLEIQPCLTTEKHRNVCLRFTLW